MMAQAQYASAARVGVRIKAFRESQGLTLRELARRTGFTHAQLSKVENGMINTPIETLARIADALGVPLGMLVSDHRETPATLADTLHGLADKVGLLVAS